MRAPNGTLTTQYEPHPYALLLPSLTDVEYEALKSDIAEHGILYPVILDDDDRVLDGVHRVRIAADLGIDPPASRHQGLDEDRKLHLAVGLNMRRRHLDADRRRALVRSLSAEQDMSVRQIASVTGWSKSTVARDLKASPFEEFIEQATAAKDRMTSLDDVPSEMLSVLAGIFDAWGSGMVWADGQWKQHGWPPSVVEHFLFTMTMFEFRRAIERMTAAVEGNDPPAPVPDWRPKWDRMTDEDREAFALDFRERGLLFAVPNGTDGGDA